MPRKGTGAGGRPPKPIEEKGVTISIVVPPWMRDELKREASERHLSVSRLVQVYIEQGMGRNERADSL